MFNLDAGQATTNGKQQSDKVEENREEFKVGKATPKQMSVLKSKSNAPKSYSFSREFNNLPGDAKLTIAKLMQSSVLKNAGLSAEEVAENPELIEKSLNLANNPASDIEKEVYSKTKSIGIDKKLHNLNNYKSALMNYYNLDSSKEIPLSLPQVELKIKMFEKLKEAGVQDIELPIKSIEKEISEASIILRAWEKQNEAESKIIGEMKKALLGL